MSSVVLAVVASTLAGVGVLLVAVAAAFAWRRRRRWARELDQEFPPSSSDEPHVNT